MSSGRITPQDLKTLVFDRFKLHYNHFGAGTYKEDPEGFAREWLAKLRYTSKDELKRGVEVWTSEKREKWPTVGQFLGAIMDSAPKRMWSGVPTFTPRIDEDWFAFPVTEKDVTGPRYRLKLIEQGHAQGLANVCDVECPVDGCHCCAVEVFLRPADMGIHAAASLAEHIKASRASAALDPHAHPRGWRWMHYAQAENLELCPKPTRRAA